MLTTKPGVRFGVITPALLHMLGALERLSQDIPEGLVVTAGSDGTHMIGSKHYTGEALDLRTKGMSPATRSRVIAALRTALGPSFTVLLEDAGAANEHLHVQVRKGRRFP